MAVDYALLGLITMGFLGITASALSLPYIKFNMILQWKKMRHGRQNIGLALVRNMGGNLPIPKVIVIKDNKEETPEALNMYERSMFTEGTLFGYPFIIVDSEDTKTSYGLYKVQCNDDGTPQYHTVRTGIKNEDGKEIVMQTDIPNLDKIKSSVTVSPYLMKTIISASALSLAVQDFIKQNKYTLYCAGGACLFALGALFFSYNNQNSIATFCGEQLANKAEYILQGVKVAMNVTG